MNYIVSFILISSSLKAVMLGLTMHMYIVSLAKWALLEYSFGRNIVKCRDEGVKSCSYPTFARGYKDILVARIIPTMWNIYRVFYLKVDCSGSMMNYIDLNNNTECAACLFAATFPYIFKITRIISRSRSGIKNLETTRS